MLDRKQAASLKVGGNGLRFCIRIGSSETFLYYECPRWFVEAKVYEAVGPKLGLISIHTDAPELFRAFVPEDKLLLLNDGEVLELCQNH